MCSSDLNLEHSLRQSLKNLKIVITSLSTPSAPATADFRPWNRPVLLTSGPWHMLPRIFPHPQPDLYIALSSHSFRFNSRVNFSVRPFLATLSKKFHLLPTPILKVYTSLFCFFSSPHLSPCDIMYIYLCNNIVSLRYWNVNPRQIFPSGLFTTVAPAASAWRTAGAKCVCSERGRGEEKE